MQKLLKILIQKIKSLTVDPRYIRNQFNMLVAGALGADVAGWGDIVSHRRRLRRPFQLRSHYNVC